MHRDEHVLFKSFSLPSTKISTVSSRLEDTPIIRTAAKFQAKINYRCLTEIISRYYGLSLMRTLTQSPYHVCYKGSWLQIQTKFLSWFCWGFKGGWPTGQLHERSDQWLWISIWTSVARCIGLLLTQNFLILGQVPTVCLYM